MAKSLFSRLKLYPVAFKSRAIEAGVLLHGFLRSWVSGDLGALKGEASGYWRAYGGWKAFLRSPAVILSAVVTIACISYWRKGGWPDSTMTIVPSLMGFTLGSMAVVLAFPSTRLFRLFSEEGRPDSYYLDLASKFVHFILVQATALLLALIGKAFCNIGVGFLGFFMLVYSITCAAMTAFALFGVAQIYNHPGANSVGRERDDQSI